jgi:UDP-GlcNAc:undecaprenyl-phosphate GlcNAc-1-phosphate transferase
MAIPALILGLPIVDILAVFAQRAYHRMNWFRATRNHVHHRLLELGFHHYQAVAVIYCVQALLVGSAIVLGYASDWLVVGFYLGVTGAVFLALTIAERRGWQIRREPGSLVAGTKAVLRRAGMRRAPVAFLAVAVPAYLVGGSALIGSAPADFVLAAAAIAVLCALSLAQPGHVLSLTAFRLAAYSGVGCVVYLLERHGLFAGGLAEILDAGFFVLLVVAVAAAIRLDHEIEFSTTPLDLLLVFVIVCAGLLAQHQSADFSLGSVILRIGALFYACELLIATGRKRVLGALQWALLLACCLILLRSFSPA